MQLYTTITPKFQVHIPVSIRKQAQITSHGKALIQTIKKSILITPLPSGILARGGTFRVKKPIRAENIRAAIDLSWGKR